MVLRRSCVLFLVLCMPFACLATEISLPDLTGDYEFWPDTAPSWRSTFFEFPEDIQSAEGIRFIVTGEWAEGELVCSNNWGLPDTSSFFPGLSMYLMSEEGFEGYYHTTVLPVAGEFIIESELFEYSENGDINQLFGVVVTAELFCDFGLTGNCFVLNNSQGMLSDVRIELLGTVSTENQTWGEVKALFR